MEYVFIAFFNSKSIFFDALAYLGVPRMKNLRIWDKNICKCWLAKISKLLRNFLSAYAPFVFKDANSKILILLLREDANIILNRSDFNVNKILKIHDCEPGFVMTPSWPHYDTYMTPLWQIHDPFMTVWYPLMISILAKWSLKMTPKSLLNDPYSTTKWPLKIIKYYCWIIPKWQQLIHSYTKSPMRVMRPFLANFSKILRNVPSSSSSSQK